jgi:hypothetical protein
MGKFGRRGKYHFGGSGGNWDWRTKKWCDYCKKETHSNMGKCEVCKKKRIDNSSDKP